MILSKMLDDLINLQQIDNNEKISSYAGPFTFEIVNDRLGEVKKYLAEEGVHRKTAKKIYNILVELLENILKHNDEKIASYLVGKEGGRYFVLVGNVVSAEESKDLQAKIENLNQLNKEELKAEYRKQIKSGTVSEKGGAGLGLLDIALKSENTLQCSSRDASETDKVIFEIKAYINDYETL